MSTQSLRQSREKKAVTPRSSSAASSPTTGTRSAPLAHRSATAPVGRTGHVSFVGAGPGDVGLLTVRAAELLRAAEIVITDAPAEHSELIGRVRSTADSKPTDVQIVDVCSSADGASLTPAARAKLVVKHAKTGARVVRLLSGDPFSCATGPEEAQACRKAGVDFEVVPGICAATAVPTYAGVPLSTRHRREMVVVRDADAKIDWSAYGGDQTLVLMSTAGRLGEVSQALVTAGRSPQTPLAMTSVGTTTDQSTIVSTLEAVTADAGSVPRAMRVVTVVGEVVNMRETLSWFETKPLFGWRVLVPRTKEQSAELSARLRSFGAIPEEVPTISVEPPRNAQQMDKAVRGLVEGRYEWVAFTSVNAVKALHEKFDEYGLDARAFSGLKVAAVGDRTAEAIESWGIRPDLIPTGEQSARGLLEDWPPFDELLDPINRVFLPRADIATDTLLAGLVELGWEVDDMTAYRTVRAAPPPAPTREAIKSGKFDAVLFTSSSTVRNLVGIAGKPHVATVVACIGPATAKTAIEHGLRVDVLAHTPCAESLVQALADFGQQRREALLEAGETVSKPSERQSTRRKAT